MLYVPYAYRGYTVSRTYRGLTVPRTSLSGLHSLMHISGAHGPTGLYSFTHIRIGGRTVPRTYRGYSVSRTYRGHTVPRTYLYWLHRLTHTSGAQGPTHVLGAHGPTSISGVSQSHAHIGGARSRAPFWSHEHIGGVGPALLLVSRAYRGCTVPCSSLRHTVSLLYRGHAAPHTFRGDSVSPISYSVTVSITVVVFHHALGWGCMLGILYVESCYYSFYNSEVHSARRPRRVTDVLLRGLGFAIYVGMLALSHPPPPLIPEVRGTSQSGGTGSHVRSGVGGILSYRLICIVGHPYFYVPGVHGLTLLWVSGAHGPTRTICGWQRYGLLSVYGLAFLSGVCWAVAVFWCGIGASTLRAIGGLVWSSCIGPVEAFRQGRGCSSPPVQ